MNKQAVLQKLAQVRMAINHALRQRRLVKQSTAIPRYSIPQPVPTWDTNTLPNGSNYLPNNDAHWIENGNGIRTYFRNPEEMSMHVSNPTLYPTRPGTLSELPSYDLGRATQGLKTNIPSEWSREDLDDAMQSLLDSGYTGPTPKWYRQGATVRKKPALPQQDIKQRNFQTKTNPKVDLGVEAPSLSIPDPLDLP